MWNPHITINTLRIDLGWKMTGLHIVNRAGGSSGALGNPRLSTQRYAMHYPHEYLLNRYQRNSIICELLFPSAVKLNRQPLVIVLEVEIYIYDINNMWLVHVVKTSPNAEGVLC